MGAPITGRYPWHAPRPYTLKRFARRGGTKPISLSTDTSLPYNALRAANAEAGSVTNPVTLNGVSHSS